MERKLKSLNTNEIGEIGVRVSSQGYQLLGSSRSPVYHLTPHKRENLQNYQKDWFFYYNTELEIKEISSKKTTSEILPTDSIYFAKASTYPRHKLRTFTKNKRVIKIEKADKIIVPLVKFSCRDETFLKVVNTGKLYRMPIYPYGNNTLKAALNVIFNETIDDSNFADYYVKYLGDWLATPVEVITLTKVDVHTGSNKAGLEVLQILNEFDNIVIEEDLEKYVSNFTTELGEEEFEAISTYLNSPDSEVVSLGLRMLTNYSTEVSAVPMSLLLLFNFSKVRLAKEWNSTTLKVIRNKFKFLTQLHYQVGYNGKYSNDVLLNFLTVINDKHVKNEKDRELVRKYGVTLVKEKIKKDFTPILEKLSFLNKFEIEVE